MRYPLLAQAKLPPRENQPARPVPERVGEPSVFQHVIYIIKENRTYDQVLGDVTEGNGDADLCVFGERVTPNQHKLVRDFVLLDNTYCCGILSADGHQWTDTRHRDGLRGARIRRLAAQLSRRAASARTARTRWPIRRRVSSGTTRSRTAKPSRDFGEFTTDAQALERFRHAKANRFLDAYHDFIGGSNAIAYSCEPDIEALRPFIVTNTVGWDLDVPDVLRAAQFIKALKQFEAADNLPNLVILWLPNDHTSGDEIRFAHARGAGGRQRSGVRPDRRSREPLANSGRTPASSPSRTIRRTAGTT